MYKSEGWEYHEKEVRQFEDEVRRRSETETGAHMEARRYHEELRANNARPLYMNGYLSQGLGGGYPYAEQQYSTDNMTVERDEGSSDMDVEPVQSFRIRQTRFMNAAAISTFASPEDERLYYCHSRGLGLSRYAADQGPEIPIVPTLLISGYGHPKLNWLYLYKQRRRLEENWVCNRFYNFQIPHLDHPEEGHRECIYTIQYSPRFLVSGSRDKTIRKWDIKTRRLIGQPMTGHHGSVLCLQFDESPGEDIIISGSSDSNIIIWQFSTGKVIKTISRAHAEAILNLKFNKKYLVTCSKDKLIKIWNRYELSASMPDYPFSSKHLFGYNRIIPTPGQQPPIAASLRVQDPIYTTILPYSTIQVLHGHVAAVNAIQLHGDEIASASGDRVIKIWNINSGTCEKTMLGHTKGIACIQYDGKTVVSGSSDFSIRIFDRYSGADIYTLGGHQGLVRTVQASRDRIVSGSYDETVRVWVRRGALRNYYLDGGEDPNSFVQASILKSGTHPPTPATSYGMGIAAVSGNSIMQIQQVILNRAHMQQQAANQIQQAQMHIHHGQPQHHHLQHQFHHQPGGGNFPANLPPPPTFPAQHLAPNFPPHVPQPLQAHHPPQNHQHHPDPQAQAGHHHVNHHNHHNHHGGHHAINVANNTCKVFKLQFDTRWVICCCQDGKIMGWDFANREPALIEVCRFFKAEGSR